MILDSLKLYGKARPLTSFACYQASYLEHKEITYSTELRGS